MEQEPWVNQSGLIFKATLIKSTPKAYYVKIITGSSFKLMWLPRSQVDFVPDQVWIPFWLMAAKGLTAKDADPDSLWNKMELKGEDK